MVNVSGFVKFFYKNDHGRDNVYRVISIVLNRTIQAIRNRCSMLKFSKNQRACSNLRRWTQINDKDLIDMMKEGLSHKDISYKLERTLPSVRARSSMLKIKNNILQNKKV